MSVLRIACAAEANYVAHSAAMLHSVLATNSDHDVHIDYMHGPDLSSGDRDRLRGMVESRGGAISFLMVEDNRLEGLPTKGFTRKATWYRIFLADLRPDVDLALYLDSDILVLDTLAPLFELAMNEHDVAAVTNVFERHYEGRPAQLGLAGPHVYFNAGVLLMNLDLMRRDDCPRRLLELGTTRAADLLWRDQDALNLVLGSRRLELHPRWNCMNSFQLYPWAADVFGAEALADARRDPAIRHFEGPDSNKPWHYLCDRDMRELYSAHRRGTPWPRVRRRGITPGNVVRRLARRPA